MADYSKQVALIMEMRFKPGEGMKTFHSELEKIRRAIEPVNKALVNLQKNADSLSKLYAELNKISSQAKKVGTVSEALNKITDAIARLKFNDAKKSMDSFTKSILVTNEGIQAQINLLERLKTITSAVTGAKIPEAVISTKGKITKKDIEDIGEWKRILGELGEIGGKQLRDNLSKGFVAANKDLVSFEQQVKYATGLVKQHFERNFPKQVFVEQSAGMRKFTGQLDETATKIKIAAGSYKTWGDKAERMNTILHELVEAMLFQTGAYDKSNEASARSAHIKAKEVAQTIALNEWLGKSTAIYTRQSEALGNVNATQMQFISHLKTQAAQFKVSMEDQAKGLQTVLYLIEGVETGLDNYQFVGGTVKVVTSQMANEFKRLAASEKEMTFEQWKSIEAVAQFNTMLTKNLSTVGRAYEVHVGLLQIAEQYQGSGAGMARLNELLRYSFENLAGAMVKAWISNKEVARTFGAAFSEARNFIGIMSDATRAATEYNRVKKEGMVSDEFPHFQREAKQIYADNLNQIKLIAQESKKSEEATNRIFEAWARVKTQMGGILPPVILLDQTWRRFSYAAKVYLDIISEAVSIHGNLVGPMLASEKAMNALRTIMATLTGDTAAWRSETEAVELRVKNFAEFLANSRSPLRDILITEQQITSELDKQFEVAKKRLALPAPKQPLLLPPPPALPPVGGGGGPPEDYQFAPDGGSIAMWGKLSDAIRKAQMEALTFGDTIGAAIKTLGLIHGEIKSLAGELGNAFVPEILGSFNTGLGTLETKIRQTVLDLRVAREEIQKFASTRNEIEGMINNFAELSANVENNGEQIEAKAIEIKERFEAIFGPELVARFEQAFGKMFGKLETFRLLFTKLGSSAEFSKGLAMSVNTLREKLNELFSDFIKVAAASNSYGNQLSNNQRIMEASAEQVQRLSAAKLRGAEIVNQEINEQRRLVTELEALIALYRELQITNRDSGNSFISLDGVTKRFQKTMEQVFKLMESGVITNHEFAMSLMEQGTAFTNEAMAAQRSNKEIEGSIRMREMASKSIMQQAEAIRSMIRMMHGQPTKFEFEKNIEKLQILFRSTQEAIFQTRQEMSRLGEGSAGFKRLQQTLNELNSVADFTNKQIDGLSKRLRSEVPRSADASRAASRMTFEGFVAMTKSQAAWMAGFTVIFGTIYKFQEALRSQIDIMNETARVMRTMRSDTMSTADMQKQIADTISKSLRIWAEETKNISQALYELGSAGLTMEQSLAALPPIMNMIVGGESDVIETSRTVAGVFINLTNSMVGMDEEFEEVSDRAAMLQGRLADAKNAGQTFADIADVMTAAVRDHLVEINELNHGLKFMIAPAKEAGLSFEQMTGILSVLNDNMIKAGMAGRSIRVILSRMSKEAELFSKAFGIAIDPTKPLDLMAVLRDLSNRFKDSTLTAKEMGDVFIRLGLRGAPAFIKLVQNFDAVENAVGRLEKSAHGAAAEMAKIQLDKPAKQAEILGQNFLFLVRQGFEPLIVMAVALIRVINEMVISLQKFDEATGGILSSIMSLAAPMAVFLGLTKLITVALKSEFVSGIVTSFRKLGGELEYANVQMSKSQRAIFNLTQGFTDHIKIAEALGNKQLLAASFVSKLNNTVDKGKNIWIEYTTDGRKAIKNLEDFRAETGNSSQKMAEFLSGANATKLRVFELGNSAEKAATGFNLLAVAKSKAAKALSVIGVIIRSNPIMMLVGGVTAAIWIYKQFSEALKINHQQMKDNADASAKEVKAQFDKVKAVDEYIKILEKSSSNEEKLEELQKKGLANLNGLIATRNTYGDVVLANAEYLEKVRSVESQILEMKLNENYEKQKKALDELTPAVKRLAEEFIRLQEAQREIQNIAINVKINAPEGIVGQVKAYAGQALEEVRNNFLIPVHNIFGRWFVAGSAGINMVLAGENFFKSFAKGWEVASAGWDPSDVGIPDSLLEQIKRVEGFSERAAYVLRKSFRLGDLASGIKEITTEIISEMDKVGREGGKLSEDMLAIANVIMDIARIRPDLIPKEVLDRINEYMDALDRITGKSKQAASIEIIPIDKMIKSINAIKDFEAKLTGALDMSKILGEKFSIRDFIMDNFEEIERSFPSVIKSLKKDYEEFKKSLPAGQHAMPFESWIAEGNKFADALRASIEASFEAIENKAKASKEIINRTLRSFSDISGMDFSSIESAFSGLSVKAKEDFKKGFADIGKEIEGLIEAGISPWEAGMIAIENHTRKLIMPYVELSNQAKLLSTDMLFLNETVNTLTQDSIGFSRVWEDFNLRKAHAEFDKLTQETQNMVKGFELDFEVGTGIRDIEKAKKAVEDMERISAKLQTNFEKAVGEANKLAASIRDQKVVLDELNYSILSMSKEFAGVGEEIRQMYVNASSGVSNLTDEIKNAVDREYELIKYSRLWNEQQDKTASRMGSIYTLAYSKITNLEESLRRYRAGNIQDLDSEWQSLIKGQMDAYGQLAKVEAERYTAEHEKVKDAQKIKDLKLEEAKLNEYIWKLEVQQRGVEQDRAAEAAKQDAMLQKQLEYSMKQSQMASDLADKYRAMASDETLSFEEREKYAKMAEQYSKNAIDSAKEAAKYDSERAKLARLVGNQYDDQQEAIQTLADKGMRQATDALEEQKKLTEDRIGQLEEEKKKWESNAATYRELITQVQGKYQFLTKQLEKLGIGSEDWHNKAKQMMETLGSMQNPLGELEKMMLTYVDAIDRANQKMKELAESTKEAAEATGGAVSRFTGGAVSRFIGGILLGGQKYNTQPTYSAGVRGATGRMVPVRVTHGEGLFLPSMVQRYYSQLAQINSGANMNIGIKPNAVFSGSPGIDTIRTMVPEGSYIMSLRGMDVLEKAASNLRQASVAAKSMGYYGGGVAETNQTLESSQPEEIGVINVRINNGDEEINLPVLGTRQNIREIERFLKREKMTKVK